MADLSDVPGLGVETIEVLSRSGVQTIGQLASQDAEVLLAQLGRVKLTERQRGFIPSRVQLAGWIAAARVIVDEGGIAGASTIDYSQDKDVLAMVAVAPVAIPVPVAKMREGGISPANIHEPIPLDAVGEDVELRIKRAKSSRRRRNRPGGVTLGGLDSNVQSRRKTSESSREVEEKSAPIDVDRVKPVESLMSTKALMRRAETSEEEREKQRKHSLQTRTRRETNAGVSKDSRRFVKGVLHPLPGRMFFGALYTIFFLSYAAVVLTGWAVVVLLGLMTKVEISKWWLVLPGLIPIFAIFYLILANGCRCRVCGQKQFLPKRCLKNRNAHKVAGLGYILPTALHIVTFKWFRCIFCGTPVRIKE